VSIFADEFTDMMTQTITVQPFIGRNDENVPSYGPAKTYLCRINFKTQNILGPANQFVQVRGQAWLDTVDPISTNDRVIFPDGSEPQLMDVNQESDEVGPAYTSFYFQ